MNHYCSFFGKEIQNFMTDICEGCKFYQLGQDAEPFIPNVSRKDAQDRNCKEYGLKGI